MYLHHTCIYIQNLAHDSAGSILTLENGVTVKCKVLIDSSGLESRLIEKETPMYARGSDKEIPTGYQIAYGFIAHVDSIGPPPSREINYPS